MNPRTVAGNTGLLLALMALMLGAPLGLAIWQQDEGAQWAYGISALLTLGVALVLWIVGREAPDKLHRKDALGTVALTWVGMGVLGGLPMWLDGSIGDWSGALFESVSGLTTTGATVISDVDNLSDATNLWRCLMHWVGGMGIVVLFVAVFPQLGVSAKQLFKSEAPGPVAEGLRPRIKQTAFMLWLIYSVMTLLCALLLWLAGMTPYDAICHAMSTLGTGGYSTRGASIGAWGSATIDWIIVVFMFLAALNFGLYYGALKGDWRQLARNSEVKFYALVNVLVIAVVTVGILPRHDDLLEAVRFAAFQVLAVTTTTGFMTEDFETYPQAARLLLFLCMFMGGCAGSTSGGIKAIRILVLIKLAIRELRLVIQPQEIVPVRVGGSIYGSSVLHGIMVFTAAFLMLWAANAVFLCLLGLDLVTAMSASIACLASIGPGLEGVGPTQNFAFIPAAGKVSLCVGMIAGRLEIFALLAVFHPACWRRG